MAENKKVAVTGQDLTDESATGVHDRIGDAPEVVSPTEQAEQNKELVAATNSGVDKAGQEAANRLEGQRAESFNITDAVLGEDEQHGINVKKAQAATFGEEYDPKTDPELNPAPITPAASQNQNNLRHPEDTAHVSPHAARNYLGQVI